MSDRVLKLFMFVMLGQVREAIELPLTQFELYRQIGIDPPRGVLMYGTCFGECFDMAVAHRYMGYYDNVCDIFGGYFARCYHRPTGDGQDHDGKSRRKRDHSGVYSDGGIRVCAEGPRMVRDVFRLARENSPAIVFIDEIDSIATKRFDAQTG
jgi:26S proteasome regulatory subunit T3